MKKYFLLLIAVFILVGCSSSKDIIGRWYYDDQVNLFIKEDKTCEFWENGIKMRGLCTWEYSKSKITIQLDSQLVTGTYNPNEESLLLNSIYFYKDLETAKKKNSSTKYDPDMVTIPDVENMTVMEAEETLKEKGLKVASNIEQIGDSHIAKGYIVKTSPAIGRTVKKGTEITLYESKGPEEYEIEDYTGKNYIEVKTILENNHGLNVVIEKKEVDKTKEYDDNLIIDQDPKVGTIVSEGANVTLFIPDIVIRYPDFTDGTWTKTDIESFCKKYGVDVEFKYDAKPGYSEGTIISQSRPKDMPVVKGVSIEIHIAKKYTADSN